MVAQNLSSVPSSRNPVDQPFDDRDRQLRTAPPPPIVYVLTGAPEVRGLSLRHFADKPYRPVEIVVAPGCRVRVADPHELAQRLLEAGRKKPRRGNGHDHGR